MICSKIVKVQKQPHGGHVCLAWGISSSQAERDVSLFGSLVAL